MHRITRLLAAPILGLAIAACSSANAAPPAGSAAASASASGPAPAASSSGATADSPGGQVQIDAKDIAFTESTVKAPANRPFQLVFTSQDSAPHNVTIVGPDGNPVFTGDVVSGPGSATYSVPALAPGTYTFRCDIHPNMTGTLVVP